VRDTRLSEGCTLLEDEDELPVHVTKTSFSRVSSCHVQPQPRVRSFLHFFDEVALHAVGLVLRRR